jgi:type II secretory pathway component PulJ
MRNNKKGFTIIELLVAVFMGIVLTAAAMSLYLTQHKQLLVQESIADTQSSLRAATAELASNIRLAGYKVPEVCTPIVASNTNPDTITIAYDAGLTGEIQIEHDMPLPSAELRCDGHDLTGLYDNDLLYIYDPVAKIGEFFLATQIQYSSSHIQHNTMTLSRRYPAGSKILKIHQAKYYIDSSHPDHPNFMIKSDGGAPQIYAENITNLNLQYLLSSREVVDVPTISNMIREVIIRVDARTDSPDSEFLNGYRTRTLTPG